MTTKDAIKHISWKMSLSKDLGMTLAYGIRLEALEIAVRAMAEEQKKGRYICAEELKHILNNSKYYGTKAGDAFADMITECESI